MLEQQTAVSTLREAGLRLTPQRRAVIDALVGNRSHPSAEELAATVAERVPGVSLSTVYKTLHELAELGLVLELDLPGSMRFDPDTADHGHFVCDRCGRVYDAPIPPELASALAGLSSGPGMSVQRVEVVLHGVCPECTGS